MRRVVISIAVIALFASVASAESLPEPVRVGVFKRTELLVAFYKSAAWSQHLKDLAKQREEAKAKGDAKRVKEIEEQGASSQKHAHLQLAGKAPLDNIFEHIRGKLPALSKKAGVVVIVEQPPYNTADVELVDVTELLVKLLPPHNAYLILKPHELLPQELKTSADIVKQIKAQKTPLTAVRFLSWQEFSLHRAPHMLAIWYDTHLGSSVSFMLNTYYHDGSRWRFYSVDRIPMSISVTVDRKKKLFTFVAGVPIKTIRFEELKAPEKEGSNK